MTKSSRGECHNPQYDCDPSKSSRTMTKLSGGECHNLTMKRVGCDPHAMTSKGASLKRRPSGHMRANVEECHDAIEEDDASSNTPPRKVGIEDMLRHKHNRDISIDMKDKIGLLKGRVGPRALTSKVEVPEGIWSCGSGVKSVHMKYECSPSLVSIGHGTDNARHRMTPHENHVYSW